MICRYLLNLTKLNGKLSLRNLVRKVGAMQRHAAWAPVFPQMFLNRHMSSDGPRMPPYPWPRGICTGWRDRYLASPSAKQFLSGVCQLKFGGFYSFPTGISVLQSLASEPNSWNRVHRTFISCFYSSLRRFARMTISRWHGKPVWSTKLPRANARMGALDFGWSTVWTLWGRLFTRNFGNMAVRARNGIMPAAIADTV